MQKKNKSPCFHFGKWKGVPLAKVDRSYLLWALMAVEMPPRQFRAVLDELIRRGLQFGRYADTPLDQLSTHYITWLLTGNNAEGKPNNVREPVKGILKFILDQRQPGTETTKFAS